MAGLREEAPKAFLTLGFRRKLPWQQPMSMDFNNVLIHISGCRSNTLTVNNPNEKDPVCYSVCPSTLVSGQYSESSPSRGWGNGGSRSSRDLTKNNKSHYLFCMLCYELAIDYLI